MKCDPGANEFIERIFSDCIYSAKDMASFCFGLSSIALWIFAAVPQFISNVQNQSSEALSVWFLTQWFLGDTLNLLGCLVQGQQLATTVYLAMYFMLSDVVMLVQFIYYAALVKRNARIKAMSSRKRKRRRQDSLASLGLTTSSGGNLEEGAGDVASMIAHSSSQGIFSTQSLPLMPVIDEEVIEEEEEGEGEVSHGDQPPSPPDAPPPPPPSPYPLYSAGEESSSFKLDGSEYEDGLYQEERSRPSGCPPSPSPSTSPSPSSSPSTLSSSAAALGIFGSAFALSLALSLPLISPSQSSSPLGMGLHGWGDGGFQRPSYTSSYPLSMTSTTSTTSSSADLSTSWSNAPFDFFYAWCSDGGDPSGDYHYGPLPPPSPYNPEPLPWWCDLNEVRRVAGTGLGYGATLLYLGSRVSQIVQTSTRGSAEGLSLLMFCLTVSANLLTGCSILLRVRDGEQLKAQLPWIAGTLGTVGLDITLTLQALHYQRLARVGEQSLTVPLLNEINIS